MGILINRCKGEWKNEWQEFAEATGCAQSMKQIVVGFIIGASILLLASLGQLVAEWLEKVI